MSNKPMGEAALSQAAATTIITEKIKSLLEQDGRVPDLDTNTPLIGSESLLDSMRLVELCLALEDAASDLGFTFDWTSESAMSRSRSMFRSISALAEELTRQSAS